MSSRDLNRSAWRSKTVKLLLRTNRRPILQEKGWVNVLASMKAKAGMVHPLVMALMKSPG